MVTLYTVHANNTAVYLPKDMWDQDYEGEEVTPTSAHAILEDNKSGSFEFSILPQHIAYDEIDLLKTTIKITEYVYDDDGTLNSKTILWKGRAISVEEDMDGIRTFICEGALAFLNDIICYPITNAIVSDIVSSDDGFYTAKAMKNEALKQALQDYLDDGGNTIDDGRDEGTLFKYSSWVNTQEFKNCIYTVGKGYNEMASFGRTFRVGNVTIGNNRGAVGFIDVTESGSGSESGDKTYPPEDYPDGAWMFKGELSTPTAAFASALDQILDVTVDLNGGHLRVRHEEVNGHERMYLDYLGDFIDADASAEYGVNIIEFNGKIELNSPVTDIIPRGAVISTWNGNETVDDAIDTSVFHIGDSVTFTGTYHYVASTSDVGYKCTPGYAKITNLNFGAKHPIHLIHTGTDSTVYGWVNQSDIRQTSTNQPFEFVGRHYESYPYTEYTGIANDGYNNGMHVVNESLMSKYGRVQQIVDFPDISDLAELKAAAEEWLEAHSSFLKQTYEISLVDLGHVYGSGETPIHLLDRIHVSMPNHNIDEYMPVTKIELDLLNPANTTISFSREINRSTVRKARSRVTAAVSDPAVELNQPNDSISQSLARNIQYISETNAHATINTSLSQNNKITLPDGETGNFDLVTVNSESTKLTFVNGLLCTAGTEGGPSYDYFTDKYIHGPGIIPPVSQYTTVTMGHHVVIPNLLSGDNERLVANILAPEHLISYPMRTLTYIPAHPSTWQGPPNVFADYRNWVEVEPYPNFYTDSGKEADDLILNDQYGTKEYGLYYRLVDGERKYFATPCIYYLPTGYTGDIYCFYAGPLAVLGGGINTDAILAKKISNLGQLKNGSSVKGSLLNNMSADLYKGEMQNDLKLMFRNNRPSYTTTSNTVAIWHINDPVCAALLMIPFTFVTGEDIDYVNNELFVCPAIIKESSEYSYINNKRMPKRIKIYSGRGSYALPIDFKFGESSSGQRIYMADMDKQRYRVKATEVQTSITQAKYYLFSKEEDLLACIEDYKSGLYSQSQIEQRHKSKIIAIRNSDNPNEKQTKVPLSYSFNGINTSYYVKGTGYDPFS